MSSKIIEALWENLNQEIPAEQMIAIEKQREVHLKKQTIFERISVECTKQILLKRPAIDRCYASYSLALQPLSNRPIFDELEISSKGMFQRISHPKHASRELTNCLNKNLRHLAFSGFDLFPALTLYPIELRAYTETRKKTLLLESCNVKERFD